MNTLIIKKSGTTRNKIVLGILIAIVIFGIAKFSMGQVPSTTPLPCPIQTYPAIEHGTSDDGVLRIRPGTRLLLTR